ncbi:MAG: FCD domain-containing protein [Planctomycetaceae bacterium]|nr:FCD domain-containing protein [Planctomycetaceae bacterium]
MPGRLHRSDEVYNHMLVRIADGEWKEGDKIPSESQLCKAYSVSRISVRSALQRLQGQGLVTTVPGIGSFVSARPQEGPVRPRMGSSITSAAFLEFFEFRQAVEFKAIELFVVHATDSDLRNLRDLLGRMAACGDSDRAAFSALDYAFHMNILHGSRNSYLIGAMEPYAEQYRHYLTEIVRLSPKPVPDLAQEHEELYRLLAEKKPTAAKEFLLSDNAYYHVTVFDTHNR